MKIGDGPTAFPLFFSEVGEAFKEKALTLDLVQTYRLFKAHGDPWGGIGWVNWPMRFIDAIDLIECSQEAL